MRPSDYIAAARVPETIEPQEFGVWKIARVKDTDTFDTQEPTTYQRAMFRSKIGFPSYTILRRSSMKTMHLDDYGEVVMEDSIRELRQHLPIWMQAKGRVLVTGLGLGCVVRGLLAKSEVDHITVIEIDRYIATVIGPELTGSGKVKLIVGDALNVDLPGERFDYAWHDLWTDDGNLQIQHARLLFKFKNAVRRQGAWAFPKHFKRIMPAWLLR
jgi:hypothetical protein